MNKYRTYFKKPYETLDKTIKEEISNGNHILDLGSNSGTIADIVDKFHRNCQVYCVDIDEESLKNIEEKLFRTVKTTTYHSDANKFLDSTNLTNLDAITVNATLHEINTPSDQREYMKNFFKLCSQKLKQDGRIIIGDYYYPVHVSDESVQEYMQQQIMEINHADPRYKFVQPSLIWEVASDFGLYVTKQIEIPAVKGIDRRYYNIIIRSKKNEN